MNLLLPILSIFIALVSVVLSMISGGTGAAGPAAFAPAGSFPGGTLLSGNPGTGPLSAGAPSSLVPTALPGAGPAGLAGSGGTWTRPGGWGYQLQGGNAGAFASSPFDLLVIDYSRDGSDAGAFSRAQVASMQSGGGRRRRVLAYLSIGEAENYRFYWNPAWSSSPPAWLDAENPDWSGNFKVKYWDPGWQRILFGSPAGYLDKIIAAGFDGVYLDIIDAYEYYQERGIPDARQRMIKLVCDLTSYARRASGRPDFGVFPQNGEDLLADPGYLAAITGIGREETYFGHDGNDEEPTPPGEQARIEGQLSRAVAAGKVVLTVDYTTDPGKMRQAAQRARSQGFVEYCGVRELDRLVPQPQ